MKNTKLRVFILVLASALSMAAFAGKSVACKSGQKPSGSGSQTCVAAPTGKSASKAKAKAKSASATARSRSRLKASSRGKTRPGITSEPVTPAAPPLPAGSADCESTQTLLQGGAAQCARPAAANGAGTAAGAQSNPGSSCFAALASSNASRQLASRVPFFSDSAPGADALANKGIPNKREKEELRSVLAGYGMCLDMAASWRQQAYAPELVRALDAYWQDAKAVLGELAAGKRSYGDAARAIADSDKAFRSQSGKPVANVPPVAADSAPAPAR